MSEVENAMDQTNETTSFTPSQWILRLFLRALAIAYMSFATLASIFGPAKRPVGEGFDILLTGTFFSANWAVSHLVPMANSRLCSKLTVVSTFPLDIENVEIVYPPDWLSNVVGSAPSRLLVFSWVALRRQPHIIGGFSLLLNGLAAALLAKMVGARSICFCVGGHTEIVGGGANSENRLFARLKQPDPWLERWMLKVLSSCDLAITMGNGAIREFQKMGVRTRFKIASGGIDSARFQSRDSSSSIDMIFVGRLAPIKRVDIFLQALAKVKQELPNVNAAIVGDGPLRESLESLALELGLSGNARFVGRQSNVEDWLGKSKIFVLTSESEGLSLAMMEAMYCGLPAVVPDVGDLGDLVEEGVNGFLVRERTPQAFAAPMIELLANPGKLEEFSREAKSAAARHELKEASKGWDEIFGELKENQAK